MKIITTDNNRWISSTNNKPVRDNGSVVKEGDVDAIANPNFGQVTEEDHPDPPTSPRILSKTAFQDYAITQLGNGLTGMARFTTIMDATRDSTNAAVRFAFARYEAAQTFEKENTATLTAVMAADSTTGHLTDAERTAILDNWPEG